MKSFVLLVSTLIFLSYNSFAQPAFVGTNVQIVDVEKFYFASENTVNGNIGEIKSFRVLGTGNAVIEIQISMTEEDMEDALIINPNFSPNMRIMVKAAVLSEIDGLRVLKD